MSRRLLPGLKVSPSHTFIAFRCDTHRPARAEYLLWSDRSIPFLTKIRHPSRSNFQNALRINNQPPISEVLCAIVVKRMLEPVIQPLGGEWKYLFVPSATFSSPPTRLPSNSAMPHALRDYGLRL